MRELRRVLVVGNRNAGRSQIAAALLQRIAPDRLIVRSAGVDPAPMVQPA